MPAALKWKKVPETSIKLDRKLTSLLHLTLEYILNVLFCPLYHQNIPFVEGWIENCVLNEC